MSKISVRFHPTIAEIAATAIPVTPGSMNYASVVFAGFSAIAALWYAVSARKHYSGPSVSQVKRALVTETNVEVPK